MTAKSSFSILHDVAIKTSRTKLFEVITAPKELEKWWPERCSGKLELNARYNFYFGPAYDWEGVVQELEPNHLFTIAMTKSDEVWADTVFSFNLEEINEQVNMKFSHSGWRAANHHFRRSSFCWALLFSGLKKYIEKGEITPFSDRS